MKVPTRTTNQASAWGMRSQIGTAAISRPGNLERDTRLQKDGDGYRIALAPAWEVRTPNGGYLTAVALRAVGANCAPPFRPLSVSVQYLAPAKSAEAEVTVRLGRVGRWVRCFYVEIRQGRHVVLEAQIWVSKRDVGPEHQTYQPPAVLADGPPSPPAKSPETGFSGNFEFVEAGATQATEVPQLRRWIRFRDFVSNGDPFVDAGRSAVLADALVWPAYLQIRRGPRENAVSLDLCVHFHAATLGHVWLLAEASAQTVCGGVVGGSVKLWTPDGRLAASGLSQMIHWPLQSAAGPSTGQTPYPAAEAIDASREVT